MMTSVITKRENQIRTLILIFIAGLALSGLTAFPLQTELELLRKFISIFTFNNELTTWIDRVAEGLIVTNADFPFLAYGTDWLAFAHLMLAVVFIGPYRDPVRNIWVIEFGIIASLCVFPLAFIAGAVRGIPFYWQLIDCSFGVFAGLLLWFIHKKIRCLEVIKGFTTRQETVHFS